MHIRTSEAAKLLNVCSRTAMKWFDAGLIDGFTLPGSGDRRFLKSSVLALARANGTISPGTCAIWAGKHYWSERQWPIVTRNVIRYQFTVIDADTFEKHMHNGAKYAVVAD